MREYGRASARLLLGDFVAYRSLNPLDPRLPRWKQIALETGADGSPPPRKGDPDYGKAVSHILKAARSIDTAGVSIERFVYLGDTQRNDGRAFEAIHRSTGWKGMAFIGCDSKEPPQTEISGKPDCLLVCANRWKALEAFEQQMQSARFPIDARTAVVVDLDKTLWGARGRNDGVVDLARRCAASATVGHVLGAAYDAAEFDAAYDRLNRVDCHAFTGDNQDHLVYVCAMIGGGLCSLAELLTRVLPPSGWRFGQFLEYAEQHIQRVSPSVASLHQSVRSAILKGDPTPLKAFRRQEYVETAERMGHLADDVEINVRLVEEIVLTQEVYETADRWRGRGALLFGLSDKPEEACLPSFDPKSCGRLPLHAIPAMRVGS